MTEQEFKAKTKSFALGIIRLVESFPHTGSRGIMLRQLLRSGTSVGANYRAACRAKSVADMVAKLRIVEEECDEAIYWMELLKESGQIKAEEVADLLPEANQILAMIVASIKTLRRRGGGYVSESLEWLETGREGGSKGDDIIDPFGN